MHLRSGKCINATFEPVETTTPIDILKLMVTDINAIHDRHEKVKILIDMYRYLYQRSQFFMKPQYCKIVSMVLKKSPEFKQDLIKIIEEYQNTIDEHINNAYQLYYYIDAVTLEYHTICRSS